MSVTLEQVRLARKQAYDRVDYWLQKYQGVTIHEAGISIPRIPKDLKPSEYGEWFDYFEAFTGAEEHGATEDYVFDEYEPPEREDEYPEPEEPEPEPEDYDEGEDEGGYGGGGEPPDDDEIAPDYVDKKEKIIDDAFDIDADAGNAISEALDNIQEQFENIKDMKGYESGLDSAIKNTNLWDDLKRAARYRDTKGYDAFMGEVTHALQRLYKHFGMTYVREY